MGQQEITTINLSAFERGVLRMLLSEQTGGGKTPWVLEKFSQDLDFTEQECLDWDVVTLPNGAQQWNGNKTTERSFDLGPWRVKKVREVLTTLLASGQVNFVRHLSLLRKFDVTPPDSGDPDLDAEFAALTAAPDDGQSAVA